MKLNYESINRILRRFSFANKMGISQYKDREIMKNFYPKPTGNSQHIFPWEIEIFAVHSILSNNEYGRKGFGGDDYIYFTEVIDAIRGHIPLLLATDSSFKKWIFPMIPHQQMRYQENDLIRRFRYNYIFSFCNNKIDMRKEFVQKFGFYYDEMQQVEALITYLLAEKQSHEINKAIKRLVIIKEGVLSQFVISRESYIEKQKEFIKCRIEDFF